MIARRSMFIAAVSLLTVSLGACGGNTETQTVTAADPPPPTASGSGPETTPGGGATGTTASTGGTGASGERTPTEPLPMPTDGTAVVQGTYIVKVSEVSNLNNYQPGRELTWTAVTRCDPKCVVELNRENANGGFVRIELPALSKTRFGRDGTGTAECPAQEPTRISSKRRTSLSVRKVRDQDGVELATEIQGFVRNRYDCNLGPESTEVLRVQGRLRE